MKKALIFSFAYFPHVGGAEIAIKEITDRVKDDFEFDLLTFKFDKDEKYFERIGNVNVYRIDSKSRYFFPVVSCVKALKLMKENDYAFIWGMMASYAGFGAVLTKILNPRVRFLLTLQEGDPIPYIKKRALPLWPLFKAIFTKADAIQAISHYLGNFGKDMGAKCPVIVVPNGVDIQKFAHEYSEEEIRETKEKIGKKDGDVTLITASRLVVKNAVEDIISSLPLLPENVKLVVAGKGDLENSLKKQTEMLGLKDRVDFLGFVNPDYLPKLLQSSDIFIRTPISEGFGNSFVEAMAAGKPVVATPVGGIVDFLTDGETGVFAEVRNHRSIADAVMKIIKNEELVSKMKRSAFEMVKEKYDWDLVAREMKNIFNNL